MNTCCVFNDQEIVIFLWDSLWLGFISGCVFSAVKRTSIQRKLSREKWWESVWMKKLQWIERFNAKALSCRRESKHTQTRTYSSIHTHHIGKPRTNSEEWRIRGIGYEKKERKRWSRNVYLTDVWWRKSIWIKSYS